MLSIRVSLFLKRSRSRLKEPAADTPLILAQIRQREHEQRVACCPYPAPLIPPLPYYNTSMAARRPLKPAPGWLWVLSRQQATRPLRLHPRAPNPALSAHRNPADEARS